MKPRPVNIVATPTDRTQQRISLILAKVEILKLKADDYAWQCHVPKDVRDELEKALIEIEELLR